MRRDAVEVPETGVCRMLTPDDVAMPANATKTVGCDQEHTAETFAASIAEMGSYEVPMQPFASLSADKWDAGDLVAAPVDAYASCLLDQIHYSPPT